MGKGNILFLILFTMFNSANFSSELEEKSQKLSYDYVELSLLSSKTELRGTNWDVEGSGFGLASSISILDNLAITGSYGSLTNDIKTNNLIFANINNEVFSLGLDYHTPIAKSTDLVFSFNAVNYNLSDPLVGNYNDNGNNVGVGIRGKVNSNIELGANLSRTTYDTVSTNFSINGLVGIGNNLQLGLGLGSSSSDGETAGSASLGIRANF